MIKPTVGRHVIFVPSLNDPIVKMEDQNLAAVISYVWSDNMVNLAVFDANGSIHSKTSVPLKHELENMSLAEHTAGNFCMWMPYQKGQAAKTEDLEKKLENAEGVEHSA